MYRSQLVVIRKSFTDSFPFIYFYGCLIVLAALSAATTISAQSGRGFGDSSINVRVYTPDGELVSLPARVILSPEGSIAGIQQTVSTDGIATFTSIPSGNYLVRVDVPGFQEGSAQVSLFEGGRAEAGVTLEAMPDPANDVGAMGFVLAPKAKKQLNQGLNAIRAEKFGEAQQHLDAAYRLAPGDPDVNGALGELYLAQNNLPEAEHYIDRATSLGPDNLVALIDAGELRIMQRNPAGAKAPLEHAVDIAPRDKFAHWLLGITYFNLGLYEKCRTEALAVIKINRGSATDGAFLLGESLAALGRTAEAVATLKAFVHDVPRDVYTTDAQKLISNLQTPAPNGTTPSNSGDIAAK